MKTYSITQLMKEIKETNNGRMNSMAMNGAQKRAAEKANERGLVKKFFTEMPCYGRVAMYEII